MGSGENSANQRLGADGPAVRPRTPNVYAAFSLGTSRPGWPPPSADGARPDGDGAEERARPPRPRVPSPPRSAAGTPRTPAAASSAAPRRRHAPGPACPPWPPTLAVTPTKPREAAFLPGETTALTFPRRPPHKLRWTPPTSGSVWRRHAAQAHWAGPPPRACACALEDGGGREPGRRALWGSGG